MSKILHTVVAIALASLLPAGTRSLTHFDTSTDRQTLFCYQCNSGVDKDCLTLQANNTNSIHYKPCVDHKSYHGHKPFCRKITQTIFDRDFMVRVIRKCGWKKHPKLDCYNFDNGDHHETVCQCFRDGCNGAGASALAMPLAVVAATSYYLLGS